MTFSTRATALALTALLLGCNDRPVILQGERLSPREFASDGTAAVPEAPGTKSVAIALPGQSANADWPLRGGTAAHAPGNAAFSGALSPLWAAGIGQGDSRKNRISTDPVVAGGLVYTLDSDDKVTATGTNGGRAWQTDLTPTSDKPGDASGGGLAAGGGAVFATTGFGELVALESGTGSVLWRKKFSAAIGGAPTLAGTQVYIVTRDGVAWALSAKTGKIAWQISGTPASAGVPGVSAPAVSGDTVIFPFSSGQVVAVNAKDGAPVWAAMVAGDRPGRAYAIAGDLTGDPVVQGGVVYTGSATGRLVATDLKTGAPLWSAADGAESPAVIAGGSVFVVNDEDQLLRLSAKDGSETWRIDLPYFIKDKASRRKTIYAYYGPILAGGRLIVASSEGVIRAFDPASGRLAGEAALPGGAASAPVVAGGVLYVVSKSGQLHAFR